MIYGKSRATSCSARTRRSARRTQAQRIGTWRTWTAGRPRPLLIESARSGRTAGGRHRARSCRRVQGPRSSSSGRIAAEKEGTFTQTQRMLHCARGGRRAARRTAAPSCGSSTTSGRSSGTAGRLHRAAGPGSAQLTWDYRAVRREWRRAQRRGRAQGDQRYDVATGAPVPTSPRSRPTDDGLWLLDLFRRLQGRREPGRPSQARLRTGLGGPRVGLGLPADRRTLYKRASATRRAAVVGAQERSVVGPGRGEAGEWTATTCPTSRRQAAVVPAAGRATGVAAISADDPFHHAGRRQGLAVRTERAADRRPDADPHYEPAESRSANPLYSSRPTRPQGVRAVDNLTNPSLPEQHSEVFPFVFSTSRLTSTTPPAA